MGTLRKTRRSLHSRRRARLWVKRFANACEVDRIRNHVAKARLNDPSVELFPKGSRLPKEYYGYAHKEEQKAIVLDEEGRQFTKEGDSTSSSTPAGHEFTRTGLQDGSTTGAQKMIQAVEKHQTSNNGIADVEVTAQSSPPYSSQPQYFTGLLTYRYRKFHAPKTFAEMSRIYKPLEALNPYRHYTGFAKAIKEVFSVRNYQWKKRLEWIKQRNAELLERKQQRLSAPPMDAKYDDTTDVELDKIEEEADLELRQEERQRRIMEPKEFIVPTEGDICIYCGGTIPYERRNSAPYPFVSQCKDCVAAAIPKDRPFSIEFYEQHLERLAVATGHIHLNNNGWFPPPPTTDMDHEEDADRSKTDDIPDESTYNSLAPKVQLFTPREERIWQTIVDSRPFDAKLWRAVYFPQRTVEEIQVKYWSRGRTLVAGGMCWSVEESNLFFQGLRRFGKHNVWAIQEHIKTRSLAEVVAMIEAMEAEVAKLEEYGMERLTVSDMPMAEEVDEDEIRLEERCAEILTEKELKTHWEELHSKSTKPLAKDKPAQENNTSSNNWKSADDVAKTRLFNMKTLADLTSRLYVQNERACIERGVIPLMYDALKAFLTPLIRELAALSHERRRIAAIKKPSKHRRSRNEIRRTEISETDVFRLLLSHQLPMGTHEFFEDLPMRLNYYVFPEQTHDPVLTTSGRGRMYDLNRDVDMARGIAPDSDNDYCSEDGDAEEAEFQQPIQSLPPVTKSRVHGKKDGTGMLNMMGVFDSLERVPNNVSQKMIPENHVYSVDDSNNRDYQEHFRTKRKLDKAWIRSEYAQGVMKESTSRWQKMVDEASTESEAWKKHEKWEKDVIHPRLRPFEPLRSSGYSTVHPTSVGYVQWRDRVDRMVANVEAMPYYAEAEELVDKRMNVYSEVTSVNKRFRSHAQIIDSRETRVYTYRPRYHREERLLMYASKMEKRARVGYRDLNRIYRAGYGVLPESESYLTDTTRSVVPSSTTPARPGAGFGLGFHEPVGLWTRQEIDPPTGEEPLSESSDSSENEEDLMYRPYVNGERVRKPSIEFEPPDYVTAGTDDDSAADNSDNSATESDGNSDVEDDDKSRNKEIVLGEREMLQLKNGDGYFEVEDSEDEELEESLCRHQILADDMVLIREAVGNRRRELEAEATHRYLRARFRYLLKVERRRQKRQSYNMRREAWIRKYWDISDKMVQRMEGVFERARERRRAREKLARERKRDLERREKATREEIKNTLIWQLWDRRRALHEPPREPELDPRHMIRYETVKGAQKFVQRIIAKARGKTNYTIPLWERLTAEKRETMKERLRECMRARIIERRAEDRSRDTGNQNNSDSDEFNAEALDTKSKYKIIAQRGLRPW
ncbi:hypothetical protein BGW42_000665 [Actinomortierella wolfii]|nr:hypothetical protein BGW42_000665 [Actinomortierella wolfii]